MNHNSNNPNTAGITIGLPNSSNKGFDIKAGIIESNPNVPYNANNPNNNIKLYDSKERYNHIPSVKAIVCYINCDGFISNHTNNKQSTIDSNSIFSNIESTSNNSTNQPFSYQDSHTTAKEIINNDKTTNLLIESKTNLLEYQGNIADTLMSGISGVFASMAELAKKYGLDETAKKAGGTKGRILSSVLFQTQGASVSLAYNYGNNGNDLLKAGVTLGAEIAGTYITTKIGLSLIASSMGISIAALPVLPVVAISALAAVGIGYLLNTQAGKLIVNEITQAIRETITSLESKLQSFFKTFDSNPSKYELVSNPTLESNDYKSLIELLLDSNSTAKDIDTLLHSFPYYLQDSRLQPNPTESIHPLASPKETLLPPNTINSHRKGEIQFSIQALDEYTRMPIANAKIQLQNVNLGQEVLSDAQGVASFSIKESEYLKSFRARLACENYEQYPICDRSIIPNAYRSAKKALELRFLGKIRCCFNGKELYICRGNKVIDYFNAYSGNALSLKEKEALREQYGYEKFVSYGDIENQNDTFYFCLDKEWQGLENKGAIPEGTYYIDINKSKDDKSSGVRKYQNRWYSKSRGKEGEAQWGQYNIPVYTNKECTSTIETHTQRHNFYIHGGERYGNNGGIDLGKENNEFINRLEHLRNQLIHTNPYVKDKPITLELLVDYTPLCIRLESIHLERAIEQENQKHKVILSGIYGDKPKDISKAIFNTQKQQTCWGYKEIAQIEEFNFEEVKIKDLIFFQKGEKKYKGEHLEIDLVKYDWQHCNKQIIVFGFLDTDISINTNGEKIIKNPKWRIITWHNPIVNPRVTLFSFSGRLSVAIGMFGYSAQRTSKKHQGIDLFAKVGTKLYAPLDCEVVGVTLSSSYGKTIALKVTESSLEILKIRRAFINYQLQHIRYKQDGSIDKENSEIEQENFNKESKEYYLFYAHLSKVNVAQGDKVVAGQIIGLSGTSGNAKGTKASHLHFEIRDKSEVKGGLLDRINPAFYMECKKLYSEFNEEERQEQLKVCGKKCELPKK